MLSRHKVNLCRSILFCVLCTREPKFPQINVQQTYALIFCPLFVRFLPFPATVVVSRAQLESSPQAPVATIVANNVAAANRIQEMRTATARAHFVSSASGSKICPTVPILPEPTQVLANNKPRMEGASATILAQTPVSKVVTGQATILSAALTIPPRPHPWKHRSMGSGIAAKEPRVTPYTMAKDGPGVAIPTLSCASGTRTH